MLRIRLSRVGKKNKAQFRITVADARRSPKGKFIEVLGNYDPHTKEKVFKKERIEYWISKGAKPSPTVHNFLVDTGVLKGKKTTSWKPKKKDKDGKKEGEVRAKEPEKKESDMKAKEPEKKESEAKAKEPEKKDEKLPVEKKPEEKKEKK